MTCPACQRTNPVDARFCIYCSAQLNTEAPAVAASVAPQPVPATGPTTRLAPEAVSGYTMPEPIPATATPAPSIHRGRAQFHQSGGALFLIGLGVLFLTGNFWPGILVLIGLTGFISEAGRGRQQQGLGALIFFTGLAFLFWSGAFFPGILFLLGIMALLNYHRGFCC
jgi:hypothetical protein